MNTEYYRILDALCAFPNSELIEDIQNYIILQERKNNFYKESIEIALTLLDNNNIEHNIVID